MVHEVPTRQPVPIEQTIEVDIPILNRQVHEKIIERPVEWERITEKAVPVEKIVEVEVETVIERPTYIENIIEVPVTFDRVIEEKFEVIVPNIVEVPVEKIIEVPVKTITQEPIEHMAHFEEPIHVVSTVVQPVPGIEEEVHFEVDDPVLIEKTIANRNGINQLMAEIRQLEIQANELNVDFTPEFNALTSENAHLNAEISELQSRLNIVGQDKDRLATSIASKVVKQVNYVVPSPDVAPLTQTLEAELSENHVLNNEALLAADALNADVNLNSNVVTSNIIEPEVHINVTEPIPSAVNQQVNVRHSAVDWTQRVMVSPDTIPRYASGYTTGGYNSPVKESFVEEREAVAE